MCAGYPALLSGALADLANVAELYQKGTYFTKDDGATPWTTPNTIKRYHLSLPFYPFRTLSPRELHLRKQIPSEFDVASPLFPANTQINFTLKRRMGNVLNFMLPLNLDSFIGSNREILTAAERTTATTFRVNVPGVAGALAVQQNWTITSVNIVLNDIYMQVCKKQCMQCFLEIKNLTFFSRLFG